MTTNNAAAAIGLVNDVLALIINASTAAQDATLLIRRAQTEGRDVSDAELDQLRSRRMDVIGELAAEIARRRAPTGGSAE